MHVSYLWYKCIMSMVQMYHTYGKNVPLYPGYSFISHAIVHLLNSCGQSFIGVTIINNNPRVVMDRKLPRL